MCVGTVGDMLSSQPKIIEWLRILGACLVDVKILEGEGHIIIRDREWDATERPIWPFISRIDSLDLGRVMNDSNLYVLRFNLNRSCRD